MVQELNLKKVPLTLSNKVFFKVRYGKSQKILQDIFQLSSGRPDNPIFSYNFTKAKRKMQSNEDFSTLMLIWTIGTKAFFWKIVFIGIFLVIQVLVLAEVQCPYKFGLDNLKIFFFNSSLVPSKW